MEEELKEKEEIKKEEKERIFFSENETKIRDQITVKYHKSYYRGYKSFIWEEPKGKGEYVIGACIADGPENKTSSFSIYKKNGFEQVLEYHNEDEISAEEFASIIAEKARKYNTALVAVERNAHGVLVIDALRKQENYYNLYSNKNKTGWLTNEISKYMMLEEFDTAIREDKIEINNDTLLYELLSVMVDQNGRISMKDRNRVIANTIAYQMRKYVKRKDN